MKVARHIFLVLGLSLSLTAPASPIEEAQLFSLQGKNAAALALLWQAIPTLPTQQRSAAILLAADLCQRNGLTELARSYYLRLLNTAEQEGNALASGDRLAIARFFADHQEWGRLQTSLKNHWQKFPYLLKSDALNLLSLADLAQHAPQAVTQRFHSERRSLNKNHRYLQFNRAVALYRQGKAYEARQLLHELEALPVYTQEQHWLRDEVRIRLASHYLHFQQGKLARPLLDNIKLQSPYAIRALVLSGWAELTFDASQPQCTQANSGKACWIKTDASGKDIQHSPSSISQTFAALRSQQSEPNLQAALSNAMQRWQLAASAERINKHQAEQQAQLEALVSLAYSYQLNGDLKTAKRSHQKALTALNAQHQASSPMVAAQQEELLARLHKLEKQFQTLDANQISAPLKTSALAAISKAKTYRQQDHRRLSQQQQTRWQNALNEYKKQAHLGLAHSSHLLSVQ